MTIGISASSRIISERVDFEVPREVGGVLLPTPDFPSWNFLEETNNDHSRLPEGRISRGKLPCVLPEYAKQNVAWQLRCMVAGPYLSGSGKNHATMRNPAMWFDDWQCRHQMHSSDAKIIRHLRDTSHHPQTRLR